MPLRAMGLACVLVMFSSVLSLRSGFKMTTQSTRPVVAGVMHVMALRNGAYQQFVHEAVSFLGFAEALKDPVSVLVKSILILPATVLFDVLG